MCYEYDEFFQRARVVEQLRGKTKIADELKKSSETVTPSKPTEPEKSVKEQEPVPA